MPADDSLEFRVGDLHGLCSRLLAEVGNARREGVEREQRILAGMAQHDRRDDDRFNSIGARLAAIEGKLGLYKQLEDVETSALERRHTRHITLTAAAIAAVAAILASSIGPLIERLLNGGHHP